MSASHVKQVVAAAESCGLADDKETLVAFALGFARNTVALTGGSKGIHKLAIYGMDASGNVAPILMLLNECNIDYEFKFTNLMTGAHKTPEFLKMNPCHTIPTMSDGPDFHLFEATAIMQYIANKYKLHKYYPTTSKARALADFMITFRNTSLVTLIAKILYPFMGFAKPITKEETDTLVEKFHTEIWPSVTKMIGYSGGPFVGGSVPNIGELACFGYLNGLLLAKEDHPIFTSDLKAYILAIRNHFTCYEKLWSGDLFKKFYAPK